MSKKIYPPKTSSNPFSASSPEEVQKYQDSVFANRGKLGNFTPGIVDDNLQKKKQSFGLSTEEQDFIKQSQDQEKEDQLMLEQEQQMEAASKFDKLNQGQKDITEQIAKNKGIDTSSPDALKDKDVNDYITNSIEYNKIRDKDVYLAAEKKSSDLMDKSDVFSWDYWKGLNQNLADKIRTSARFGRVGNTPEERDKYKQVAEVVRKYEKPVAEGWIKDIDAKLDVINQRYKDSNKNVIGYGDGVGSGLVKSLQDFEGKDDYDKTPAEMSYEKTKKALQGFVDGTNNIFSGAQSMSSEWASAGISDLAASIPVYMAAKKLRNKEELTVDDKEALEAYNASQQVDNLGLDKDRYWYRTGKGAAQSAVFMEQAVMAEPGAALVGKGISKMITPLAEKLIGSTIVKSLGYTEGSIAAKTLETLATKGIGIVEKGIIGNGEVLAELPLMPSTYDQAIGKFVGQSQMITHADGKQEVLVSKSQRIAYEKEAKAILSQLDVKDKEIKAKGQLTDADKQLLDENDKKRQATTDQLSQVYTPRDKSGNPLNVKDYNEKDIINDIGEKDAFLYGYSQNFVQTWTEKYVGEYFDKLGGVGTKLNRYLGKNKHVGGAYTKASEFLSPVTSAFSRGNSVLNKLGKISENVGRHTGASTLFHSIPGEIAEEIAGNLMPTYMSDYSDQLDQLKDPSFYIDVASQTMLMGAGPTTIGTTQHLAKFATNKEYRSKYRENVSLQDEVKKIYRNIDKSVSDDDLAQHIAMRSGNTLFDKDEYNHKINTLRLEGKTAEADTLEKRSMLNLAGQALRTGTLNQFERTLSGMQYNDNLSDASKKSASEFMPKIAALKDIQEKHGDKVNYGDIINRKMNSILHEDTMIHLDNKIAETRKEVDSYLNKKKSIGQLDQDFNIGYGFANSIDQNDELNQQLIPMMEESPALKHMMELQYTKDIYTESDLHNSMKLNYELDPKNQAEIKAKYDKVRKDAIVANTDATNLADNKAAIVKENLNNNSEDTSVTNQLDKAAYDKENKEQVYSVQNPVTNPDGIPGEGKDAYQGPDVGEVKYSEDFVKNLQDAINGETAGNKAVQGAHEIVNQDNQDVATVEEDAEGTPFNAPIEVTQDEKSARAVEAFKKVFQDEKGTFKGVLGAMINQDPSFTDEYFNHLVEGYNVAKPLQPIGQQEALRIYEQVFGDTMELQQAMAEVRKISITPSNTATSIEVAIVATAVIENETEKSNNTNIGGTIDMVTKLPVKTYDGYKTIEPDVKLAFIGQRINISEDGSKYDNATNEVTPEAHAAIHFENFKPGSKVKLDFDWDYFYNNEKITTYTQLDKGAVDVNSSSIQEFVENIFGKGFYPQFLDKIKSPEGKAELLANEAFLHSMPTNTTLEDGTKTSLGINSADWWNTKNVGLEENPEGEKLIERQKQTIDEAKKRNIRLRKSLAQGNSVEMTVDTKTEGFHNKQLLETDQEKEQGYSEKFQSVIDAFDGNKEAAMNTIGVGTMDSDAPTSYKNDGSSVVKVGDQKVILTKENSNIEAYKKAMTDRAGGFNGRSFILSQSGYNDKGDPQYIMRAVVNDHASKSADFNNQYNMYQHIKSRGQILNGEKDASENEKIKAKKVFEFFKKEYNIDITDWKQLASKLGEFYPQLKKANQLALKPANRFTQDYKITQKETNMLPDLTGFNSVSELEHAIFSESGMPKISAKELFMKNAHTQYIFSEITDPNKPSVWTSEVQPKIKFSDNFTQEEKAEDQKRDVEEKVSQLKNNVEIKAELATKIAETTDPLEKRALERESKKLDVESTQIKNELVSVGLNPTEVVKEKPVQEKPVERKFDENDLDTVNQHLMYSALKAIKTKDFTKEDIINEVEKQIDKLVKSMRDKGQEKEAAFVEKNRANILGTENYDGSVEEMIDTLYDIQRGEAVEVTSDYVKNNKKESFENDITASLSMRVKMLLSGVKDTRANTSENIAGLPEYFTFKDTLDFLQQAMAETHNNSLEDLKGWIFKKVKKNPKEFNFYYDIYRRLRTLEKADGAFLNEIMYFLHQPKVDMTFMMYAVDDKGIYRVQKYDANAKNPQIAKLAKWGENLKTSPLISLYEENFYKVNQEAYDRTTTLYNEIKEARDNNKILDFDKINEYFSMFGIRLNHATLGAMNDNSFNNKDYTLYSPGNTESGTKGQGILASNQTFELLYKNLQSAKGTQDGFKGMARLTLNRNSITSSNEIFNNLLKSNTTGALKRLVDTDNMMSAYNLNSMRIAGKTINPFQQSKSITNTVSKLKNDPEFVAKLKATPITGNSMILEMLEKYPELTEYFSIHTTSLEALKQMGTDSRDDMGPTELSDLDSMVTLFNLFAQDDGNVTHAYNGDDSISIRKGSMSFPALSDSSQQPIINAFMIDLKKSNFDDLEMDTLSDNIVSILVDKLVKNELNRTAAFLKSGTTTNIKGHDAGAQFVSSLMSLNSLLVDSQITQNGETVTVKRPLIEVFKNHNDIGNIAWKDNPDAFVERYKKEIYDEVRENVKAEVEKTMKTFTSEGILNVSEAGSTLKHIDGKYLATKGDMNSDIKAKLIAHDYVINNLINLNEIQNLFAGDAANYFKDNMGKDLEFGLPKVTVDDLVEHYYSKEEVGEQLIEALKTGNYTNQMIEVVKSKFPELLSATEVALTDNLDQRIEDTNPVARIKMVKMFKDVQNNLSKRLKALISPGSQYPNSMDTDQRYYQIMLQDVENSSEVLHYLAQRFHPNEYEKMKDKIDEFKKIDDIYESNRNDVQKQKHTELKKELAKNLPKISSFLKNASTDAQEYATWQDNLNQLRNQGRVIEDEFNAIFDKLHAQSLDVEKLGYISKENEWKDSEKDLRKKSVMQVSKPLYSGHHLETSNGYNHSRYIYIKSSSFPLTPELTVGFPKLNVMRKNMEKWQEVDPNTRKITSTIRASYDSANKVGAVKTGLPINELYKDNPDFTMISSSTVELEKSNFYIQQDKPFKGDENAKKGKRDEITRATQFEKILLGDGISQIEDHVFPNLFDESLLKEFGIETENNMLNGPKLKQIYDNLYKKEQGLLTDKFNRELGIEAIDDIANGKPEVMEKLVDKLKSKLSNKQDLKALELEYKVKVDSRMRTVSKQGLSDLQGDAAKKVEVVKAQLKIPLYMMPNSNKFESVLNSMVNKSNINLKLPGSSSPVGSQEGFDYKGYSPEEYATAKKNGLITTKGFDPEIGLQATRDVDGKLKSAQVFIANKFKVYDKASGQYNYINLKDYVDENNQIDTSKLPEELLSMFSFRIPTSSHQSGVIIEIAGFLPHTSADLMIVPKDHTTQIGEDYDIDMRYMYQYNYIKDMDGNLKRLDYFDIDKTQGSYKDIKNEYETAKKQLFDEFFRVTDYKPRTNNPFWKANKQIMLEIAFLKESLEHGDIQSSRVDKIIHALFDEDMIPNSENLTSKDIKDKIKELENNLIPSNDVSQKSIDMRKEYADVSNDLQEAFHNQGDTFLAARDKYNNSIDQKANELKVMENNLVGLYKSVFSSNDDSVQKLINKTLSTDSAEDTANEMDKKLNSENPSPYYSFHTPSVQREAVRAGSSGKIGIGEHSNAVTMNSIFQQSTMEHAIYKKLDDEGEVVPYNIRLGNFVFDGKMGAIEVNGVRISEMAMEDQNSATDNQKLQIMDRRNEDKNTMSVLKILHSVGFDKDLLQIPTPDGNKQLSYASLFINQPIIREYSKIVNNLSSVSSDKKGNPKKQTIKQLITKLEASIPEHVWALDENGKPEIGTLPAGEYTKLGKTLNSQTLYDQLLKGDDLSQYMILKNFEQLQNAATTYNEMQKLVNIENGGMGVSYFNTIENVENMLKAVAGEIKITNSEMMIGDFDIARTEADKVKLEADGYVPVITKSNEVKLKSSIYNAIGDGQSIWIKPTNHFSHKLVNSTALGYNTYNSLFPYNGENIDYAINSILSNLNISNSNDDAIEQKYNIVSDLKDYIYTNNQSLFGDVQAARQEMFFNDPANNKEAFATYMLKLSQNDSFADLFRKPFFRDLQYSSEAEGVASIIKFNNSDISKINTTQIYNNFTKMMRTNKELPSYNGRAYNYKELMKDLLKYSLLADQGRGAIGFRQHLPIELFEKYGVTKGISNTSNVSGNIQGLSYHGATKNLIRAFQSAIEEDGSVKNENKNFSIENIIKEVKAKFPKLSDKEIQSRASKLRISRINNVVNVTNIVIEESTGQKGAFTYDFSNDKAIFNYYDGSSIKSTFVKQYIQHNPKLVPVISGAKLNEMMKSNGYTGGLDDITNNRVKEFYFKTTKDFMTLKDTNGKILLYEQVADNFFRQIPILGVFGLKEYNIRTQHRSSNIEKNNVVPSEVSTRAVDQSSIPSLLNTVNEDGQVIGTNLEKVVNVIQSENKTGMFTPLFQLFKQFVKLENVQIVTGPASTDYKARYFPSGKIEINPSLLTADNFNMENISKVVAEEMMHHITVNTVGRFINFTGIDPKTGKISYEPVKDDEGHDVTVPAEVQSLVSVYNFAIQKMAEKHGLQTILDKMNSNDSHLGADTGVNNDAYRVSNIHEFIAGVFLRDEDFAKEMANTPYRSTDKSIAEKFMDVLSKLFYRVIPSLKKETVSGEVAASLTNLLKTIVNQGKESRTINPQNIRTIYDTAEKRTKFAESLKVLNKAKMDINNSSVREDLMSQEDDNMGEFPQYEKPASLDKFVKTDTKILDAAQNEDGLIGENYKSREDALSAIPNNQSLNSPVSIETLGEQAIKCK